MLRPALIDAGIAVKVGEDEKSRAGVGLPAVAFHAFRHACGTLLHGMEKRPVQAQGWLRHSQLMTTMNIYTHADDEGLGSADAFDEILDAEALRAGQPRGNPGATEHPETAVKLTLVEAPETV